MRALTRVAASRIVLSNPSNRRMEAKREARPPPPNTHVLPSPADMSPSPSLAAAAAAGGDREQQSRGEEEVGRSERTGGMVCTLAPTSVQRKAQVESAALTLAKAATDADIGRERSETETEEPRQGDGGAYARLAEEMFKRFDSYVQKEARSDLDDDAQAAPMLGKEHALKSAVEQGKEEKPAAAREAGSAASAAGTAAQVATIAIGVAAAATEAVSAEVERRKDEETRRAASKLMTDALPVLLVVDPHMSMSTTRLALAEAAQHLKNEALTKAANSRQRPAIGRRPRHDVLVADGGVTAVREHKAER